MAGVTPGFSWYKLKFKIMSEQEKLYKLNLEQTIEYICDWHDLKCTYWGGDTDHEGTKEAKEDLRDKIQSRITGLESYNKKMEEALEKIIIMYHEYDRTPLSLLEQVIEIAEQALKPKEEQ